MTTNKMYMSSMCIDCPHNPLGEAITSLDEMDELEAMAKAREQHECHNHRDLLCIGQHIGCFAVIERIGHDHQ